MPWIETISTDDVENDDVARWDYGDRTFAIYRTEDDEYFASDGLCTHEKVHLADGLLMEYEIECPKHNGRFDIRDGAARRSPACERLRTYRVKIEGGMILLELPD